MTVWVTVICVFVQKTHAPNMMTAAARMIRRIMANEFFFFIYFSSSLWMWRQIFYDCFIDEKVLLAPLVLLNKSQNREKTTTPFYTIIHVFHKYRNSFAGRNFTSRSMVSLVACYVALERRRWQRLRKRAVFSAGSVETEERLFLKRAVFSGHENKGQDF